MVYTYLENSVGGLQNMERKITDEFLKWKRDVVTKPFCLYGPRQVGKTYSVISFGRKFYKNVAYFDTNNNNELKDIMLGEKVLDKLIMKLSLLSSESLSSFFLLG